MQNLSGIKPSNTKESRSPRSRIDNLFNFSAEDELELTNSELIMSAAGSGGIASGTETERSTLMDDSSRQLLSHSLSSSDNLIADNGKEMKEIGAI